MVSHVRNQRQVPPTAHGFLQQHRLVMELHSPSFCKLWLPLCRFVQVRPNKKLFSETMSTKAQCDSVFNLIENLLL
jgi:hypothetical protein